MFLHSFTHFIFMTTIITIFIACSVLLWSLKTIMNWITPTSQALGLAAQSKLLKHFVKTPFEVKATPTLNFIDIRVNKPKYREERVLVLMHGYGSGLGFFFDNYDAFATHFDRVIAVDWKGMGLSNRSVKQVTTLSMFNIFCKQKEEKILEVTNTVTNEFIDSLEELRVEQNLSKFVLAGHSLGGYLSARYALKYPEVVEGLILISPAGVQPAPPAEDVMQPSALDWKMRLIDNLWKMNFTPQNIVRILGPKGPGMVTSAINRRFSERWTGEDLQYISDYTYHITAAPGNGEYALNALLVPKIAKPNLNGKSKTGVYARQPLESDLCNLKMPVLMLFGDTDWLAYPGAPDSVALWRKHGVAADLSIIRNAGHHLYTDNSVDFNHAVVDWAKRSTYLTSDSAKEGAKRAKLSSAEKNNLIDVL